MKKILVILNVLLFSISLYGCGGKDAKIDNEKTIFTMSTDAASGVFSPFYSTSGVDSTMAGMTQISMLSSTANGEVAYGDKEAVVVKDMSQTMYDEAGKVSETGDKDGTTVYQFVIKNGLKFSDGTPLTIHDILFNMYVYLDPAYTGSNTMYSTDIKGLSAYRTQDSSITEDDELSQFEAEFVSKADEYMDLIGSYVTEEPNVTYTDEEEKNIKSTIDDLKVDFKKELEENWKSYENDLEGIQDQYNVKNVWQAFLLYEGILNVKTDPTTGVQIKDDKGIYQIDFSGWDKDSYDKEYCINTVFNHYIGTNYKNENILNVLYYYNCGSEMYNDLVASYKSKYFEEIQDAEGGLLVKNVSGITVIKGSDFVNGSESYTDEYDVLQVVINGVDPKAIWNFGFTVAPMHYYSNEFYTTKAMDADVYSANCEDFGVKTGDPKWFQDVVKSKNSIPMGAGAYKMSTANGTNDKTTLEDYENGFSYRGIIHFERNDHFLLGKPLIKYIDYKEVSTSNIMNSVVDGSIHYATPSATEENLSTINQLKGKLDYTMNETSGYGYIGINAKFIKDIEIRRAIMTAMNTDLITDYYPNGLAEIITRPMSLVSWVYGESGNKWDPEDVYPYTKESTALEKIDEYVAEAGYVMNPKSGKYSHPVTGEVLKYTFTIAGTSTDHPAYNMMLQAANLLNENGWTVTVRTDSTALTKLSNGGLQVWAAAWSSTIDPDMYQVYHVDSNATSVKNWGYDYIKSNQSEMAEEYNMILELSDLIDKGRSVLDKGTRTGYYREALDLIMKLAVEMPTYQRNDLNVYNCEIIDTDTLIPKEECTPYYGPLSEIWNVSLKETK